MAIEPKTFLIQVRKALSACRRKGYFDSYNKATIKSNETITQADAESSQVLTSVATMGRALSMSKRPKKKKKTSKEATVQETVTEGPDVPEVPNPSTTFC